MGRSGAPTLSAPFRHGTRSDPRDTRLNHCTATMPLSNGKVELSGPFPFIDTLQAFRLAVIGGSGA
jgi:hypothetical protein